MGTCALGQGTGMLRLLCEPKGQCAYVLDGRFRMHDREVMLSEGPHRFVFWAPERRMLDTVLNVAPEAMREVRIRLRYSEEYMAYRKAADRYVRSDRWMRYAPPVATIATGIWAGLSVAMAVRAQRDVDALADAYAASSDPGGIVELKAERIPAANRALRSARLSAGISTGACVVSGAAWWYLHQRRRGRTPPVFEDKEKLRFDGLVWMPQGHGGVWLAGLTIPLR
jgi:hypothetical protein